jgi:hypothetical protein
MQDLFVTVLRELSINVQKGILIARYRYAPVQKLWTICCQLKSLTIKFLWEVQVCYSEFSVFLGVSV